MKYDKNIVQNNFNRASQSYDRVASIQRSCGQSLVSKLQQQYPYFYPQNILDVGTGTGHITELLNEIYPLSNFTLNDLSHKMITVAKNKLLHIKNMHFILGDMEKQNFERHDLAISNLAIQWTNNMNNTINKLYKTSKICAFTCLIDGTFKEWIQVFDVLSIISPVIKYPKYNSVKSYIISLNPKRYNLYIKKYTLTFETIYAFMKYLKKLGVIIGSRNIGVIDLKRILNLNIKNFSVSYRILFCIIQK